MEFVLGTAQLGMPYGIVNDSGFSSEEDAVALVGLALDCGVKCFDTAREYGRAESILGRVIANRSGIRVVTKLGVASLSKAVTEDEVRKCVDRSVEESCRALRTDRLDVLLLHRWEHRYAWNEAAWNRLLELQEQGRIAALGASLYEPWEALEALGNSSITHLQIPLNVLDWRWRDPSIQLAFAGRRDVTVYARSVLLQGILAHDSGRWPSVEDFGSQERSQCAKTLRDFAWQFQRESVSDLCLAYVRAVPGVSAIVLGCDDAEQLRENVALFSRPALTQPQVEQLVGELPRVPEAFLNPTKWGVSHEPSSLCAH